MTIFIAFYMSYLELYRLLALLSFPNVTSCCQESNPGPVLPDSKLGHQSGDLAGQEKYFHIWIRKKDLSRT